MIVLNHDEWSELCYRLAHPTQENIEARESFLAKPDNLNEEEILMLLNEDNNIKEWF